MSLNLKCESPKNSPSRAPHYSSKAARMIYCRTAVFEDQVWARCFHTLVRREMGCKLTAAVTLGLSSSVPKVLRVSDIWSHVDLWDSQWKCFQNLWGSGFLWWEAEESQPAKVYHQPLKAHNAVANAAKSVKPSIRDTFHLTCHIK